MLIIKVMPLLYKAVNRENGHTNFKSKYFLTLELK